MGFGVSDVTFLSRKGFVHVDLWYILWPVGRGGKGPKDCCWKRPRAQGILILCGKNVQMDVSKFGAWPHKFHWGQHQTSTKDMCMKPLVMWSTHPPKKKHREGTPSRSYTLPETPLKMGVVFPWKSGVRDVRSWWVSGEGRCLQGGPPLWCAGNRYLYDSPFAPISIPSILALFQKNGARSSRPNNTSCTRLTWLSLHLQAVLCWHFNQSLIHWVLLRRKTWVNMSKSNAWWWRHNNLASLFCDKNLWVWVWLKGTWVGFLPSLCEELQSSRIEHLVEKNLIH